MADKPTVAGKTRFRRVSIGTNGATMTVIVTAKCLSEALDQEISYYWLCRRVLAQVNISEDD